MTNIKLNDIVRLSNGDEFIITNIKPNRPVNPLCGVKVNGKGAEYRFGSKHRPIIIGCAQDNHPALIAMKSKRINRGGRKPNDNIVIVHLLDAIEAEDWAKTKILASVIRTMV